MKVARTLLRTMTQHHRAGVDNYITVYEDENGKVIPGTEQYTVMQAKSSYGDALTDSFVYKVTIPAHSVVQFSVEYNLLANSCGNVPHWVELK